MQRIYFVADRQDQLRRVDTEAVEALWEGREGTNALG